MSVSAGVAARVGVVVGGTPWLFQIYWSRRLLLSITALLEEVASVSNAEVTRDAYKRSDVFVSTVCVLQC